MNLHSYVSIVESSLQTKRKKKVFVKVGSTRLKKRHSLQTKKNISMRLKKRRLPSNTKKKEVFVKVGSTRLKKRPKMRGG